MNKIVWNVWYTLAKWYGIFCPLWQYDVGCFVHPVKMILDVLYTLAKWYGMFYTPWQNDMGYLVHSGIFVSIRFIVLVHKGCLWTSLFASYYPNVMFYVIKVLYSIKKRNLFRGKCYVLLHSFSTQLSQTINFAHRYRLAFLNIWFNFLNC